MNKHTLLLTVLFLNLICTPVFAQNWQVATFGQSTDLNFSSLIDSAKIGWNNAWLAGNNNFLEAGKFYTLPPDFFIESRGGKIANSHDGMTVFYTIVPVTQTFRLEADLTLEQIGPEVNGKSPAGQEGAGLFVRDIIGPQRQEPQSAGTEEYPQASNILMNAFITQNKKNDNLVQITSIVREGVIKTWGNEGITIKKQPIIENINFTQKRNIHMTIERLPEKFILTAFDTDRKENQSWQFSDYSGFMNQLDNNSLAIGFFAARNAKLRVKNASFKPGKPLVDYKQLTSRQFSRVRHKAPELFLASPQSVVRNSTTLQFLANQAGIVSIDNDKQTKQVQAGELVQFPVTLQKKHNDFTVNFNVDGNISKKAIRIEQVKSNLTDPYEIYVCSDCRQGARGSKNDPVDLQTAVKFVAPGGNIYLNDGQYHGITLDRELSGIPGKYKTISAINPHKAIFINKTFNLDASYWHLKSVVFDGNVDNGNNKPAYLRIAGSYNIIEHVIARNNDDTGISISAKDKNRFFWPAHNLVLNSDSYNNLDLSGINADGFAAKLGVGPGNIFRGCIAHNNADDGWDLFNKIEDGPNASVTIENSVAYENGLPYNKADILKGSIGNGFKLGGEGQPVNHKVINSIAINNNMDGFTDNFNTGSLIVRNNIAMNNARYNYILRTNPYKFPSSILFDNNYSIRDDWENKIKDFLGDTVNSVNYKLLVSHETGPVQKDLFFTRDDSGNIIYPDFFLNIINKFN